MEEEYPLVNRINFVPKFDTRKRKTESLIMKRFKTNPKKEYVMCKVIRGHKKLIRNILSDKISKSGITKVNLKDRRELLAYRSFNDHLIDNLQTLDPISQTDSGPKTDGQSKRKKKNRIEDAKAKSFNNNFCKDYFSLQVVRESFSYFVELVFTHFDPDLLSYKFGFKCCNMRVHMLECFEVWMLLKFYLQEEMFYTLEYEKPVITYDRSVKLPDISGILELINFKDEKEEETQGNFITDINLNIQPK